MQICLNNIMRKLLLFIFVLFANTIVNAQDDLLKMLDEMPSAKAQPVIATFKSTRLVNLHTNEQMRAKHLDFRIQHRFQAMGIEKSNHYGLYNLFGLDGAQMRLGLEYGITNKLMLGIGRSTSDKTYDAFVKYKIAEQTVGKKSFPVGINYFGNIGINTMESANKNINNYLTSRFSYAHQLLIARKFNDYFSILLAPTFIHYNLVDTKTQPNDVYAIGLGASVKISPSTRFNVEYIPRLNTKNQINASGESYYNSVSIGFDIETGGHVFQLHFTNSNGLIEQQFIGRTVNPINLTAIRLGFNLSRTFSFVF